MLVVRQTEELLRAGSDEEVQLVLHLLQLVQRRQEPERVPEQEAADHVGSSEKPEQLLGLCFFQIIHNKMFDSQLKLK